MSRYLDYIKRGEFLMAPYLSYKSQYILKCCECEKYFDQLESLFSHCMGHYQNENNGKEWSLDEVNNGKTGDMKRTSLKYENITETEGEDPLNSLEGDSTPGNASLFVKEEPKYGSYQMDQIEHDEYEPVEDLTDVADDTNSETVESSVEDPLTSMEWDCTPESASHIVKEEPKYGSYQMDQIEHDEYEPVEELTDVPDDTNSETVESNVVAMENKCFKSDSFVRDFMKSKLNVTTLIAAYKEQPKLWNNNIPNIRTEERNRILNDISKELRKEVNVNFSYAQVAAIIAHMRYTYRVKMKRMQTTDQHVAQTWYFEHLSFLKPFLEKISTAAGNSLQPDLPRKHLTQILDIYKRHPHLWNTDLAENCCENKRTEAFEEMLIDIESEIHLKINQNTLKEYIESIRNCVAKLKHRDMINSKKETSKPPEYYTHMKFLYNHVGPFKCSECGRKPKNALAFKVHKSQHDGSMPLICSLCNKKFKLIITYKSHVKRHMEDLKVGCKECGKRFVNSYNLKIHMRCHTGAKPFCCEICGSSFRHIQTFTSHKRRHEKKFMHNCPICSKGFYTKGKHDDHVRSHKNIREFECKTCGKAFKTKKTLLQHEVTHDDARKHACTLCGKTFKLKVGVIQHMKTHGSTVDKNTAIE